MVGYGPAMRLDYLNCATGEDNYLQISGLGWKEFLIFLDELVGVRGFLPVHNKRE